MYDIDVLAQMVHELIRICQIANREQFVAPHWENLGPDEEWMRESSRDMVRAMVDGLTPEQIHDRYLSQRTAEGWEYGPVKSFEDMTNPNMVPYYDLPVRQFIKDALARAVVNAVRG